MKNIYLDNNATTKIDDKVVEAMLPYLKENYANPSSMYNPARITSKAIEESRKQIADFLGIHESTVSRISNKKNSKFIQTEWGIFPLSYFFASGLLTKENEQISSTVIKSKIQKYLEQSNEKSLSDSKLEKILNSEGIKISRRTIAKYRQQLGIENSYSRHSF